MKLTESVDARTQNSLVTTARKTYVIDIAPKPRRPGISLLCVHAKEFHGVVGTKLLARYLRACIATLQDRATCVFVDANVTDDAMCEAFGEGLSENNFEVLSPAGQYCTTQKTRSEMHGQIYDKKKCLNTQKAHKDFVALFQNGKLWNSPAFAAVYPDLKAEPQDLPASQWPSDH